MNVIYFIYISVDVMCVVIAVLIFASYVTFGGLSSLFGDYSVLELLHVVVGDLANISGAHVASIFRVQIYRMVSCCVCIACIS